MWLLPTYRFSKTFYEPMNFLPIPLFFPDSKYWLSSADVAQVHGGCCHLVEGMERRLPVRIRAYWSTLYFLGDSYQIPGNRDMLSFGRL